jgi:hypothetical protein
MGDNVNFNDFSSQELSATVRLKSNRGRGLTDSESQGLTRAANTLMQLIQLDEYRTQQLKQAASDSGRENGRIQDLTQVTEDMAVLLDELVKLTPAVAAAAERIAPDLRDGLKELSGEGKLVSNIADQEDMASSDPVMVTNEWWFDPFSVTAPGTTDPLGPEPFPGGGKKPVVIPDGGLDPIIDSIGQTIDSFGAQFITSSEQIQQELEHIITGDLDPHHAHRVVEDLAHAYHQGSGGGGGGFDHLSPLTIGALFGTLIGYPAIGVLVGLIVGFIERLLAAEEDSDG